MHELIFTLHKKDKDALGDVRCMDGLKVAADDDRIWLRGLYDTAAVDKTILQLPVQHSFYIDGNNLLFSPGNLTPAAILPSMEWIPVAEFVNIKIPVAALPGQLSERATIRVMASSKNKTGDALLTTLQQWKHYAANAPAIRLAPLQFAVSQNNNVLIIGYPLPAIPGKELWMADHILLPNGYDFEIPMATAFINEKLNAEGDAVLLFDTDGSFEKIGLAFFAKAKRSAVRLTQVIVE